MTKKTVPLSQIFEHAVNELNSAPQIKSFDTLSKIVHDIPQSAAPLRNQIVTKMKAFYNNFLPSLEMYYVLCLMDHIVKRENNFRLQMVNPDLLEWFECIANFEKSKKKKRIDIVTDKMMRIVQTWGVLFPKQLFDYTNMYMKYKKKGVTFVLPEPTDFELYIHPDNGLGNCIEKITEAILMIDDALDHIYDTHHIKSAKIIIQHAQMVKSQLEQYSKNFKQSNEIDEQQSFQMIESLSLIESKIAKLEGAIQIVNPDSEITKTVSMLQCDKMDQSTQPQGVRVHSLTSSSKTEFKDTNSINDELVGLVDLKPKRTSKVFSFIGSVRKRRATACVVDKDG
ncbi:hypothetical protein EIN_410310 [Entamoeba invadens IP1]|uniref:VHS domain-containing protein n=1 Tax=Entamoeba invadens IP1 TaxID=370355 RepID=A0A0A1TWU6_ENTIV|nr:hypothetical protein EIN_410310 [Entamoeba invadens IP1]ELP85692.1 hypothetical protein EIN_410310 [Entamoeba invadens IP1]|eukprot:XP_004185038.1 hypothetical protein EIN_410310 [Entamoeba invadens IP1]